MYSIHHVAEPSLVNIYNQVEFGYYCMFVMTRSWCSGTPPTPNAQFIHSRHRSYSTVSLTACMVLKEPPPYENNNDEGKSTNRPVLYVG